MKIKYLCLTAALLFAAAWNTSAQSTAFTYQGRLDDAGTPANGAYDFRFTLWNAAVGGAEISSTPVDVAGLVSNGLFTATVDFGFRFDGTDRWLEIGVATNGSGLFNTLSPRQRITSAPYAINSAHANAVLASNIVGTLEQQQLPPTILTNGASGVVLSGTFTGNGGGLTSLDASQLTSGTVADARQSANVAMRIGGNNFTGTQFIAGTGSIAGALYVNSPGFGTAASIIRARANDQFPFAAQTFGGVNLLLVDTNGTVSVSGTLSANSVTGNGSGLTSLNATNLTGTIADSRLSANVALRSTANTFTGNQTVNGEHRINGVLNLNTPSFSGVTAFLRARPGDNVPLAVQGTNGVNFLLVSTNSVNVTGALNVNSGGYPDVTGIIRARPGDQYPFVVQGTNDVNYLTVTTNGTVTVSGEISTLAINITSDRDAKERFAPVNTHAVLEKLAGLPITEWQYKSQTDVRHIGPMAQDFYAAFGVGRDERHITSVDADGIALAAIQALNEKLQEQMQHKDNCIQELQRAVAELRTRLQDLATKGTTPNR